MPDQAASATPEPAGKLRPEDIRKSFHAEADTENLSSFSDGDIDALADAAGELAKDFSGPDSRVRVRDAKGEGGEALGQGFIRHLQLDPRTVETADVGEPLCIRWQWHLDRSKLRR